MATTALIAAKPFKSIANSISPITGFSVNDNRFSLLHTGDHEQDRHLTGSQVNDLFRQTTGNLLLVHAGNAAVAPSSPRYEVIMKNETPVHSDYHIIYKGNLKIGILRAAEGDKDALSRINEQSAWLKKTKGCKIVICLSDLGYSNKNGLDDRKLAKASTDIDIILSGHPTNICKQPFVSRNAHKQEVIINSASGYVYDFGNVEIGFDDLGRKNHVAINNLRKRFNPDPEA